ncbi:DUF397 domain-containing protein [Streptomyces sp. B-S-A8]|uniref:DUF397 domain-containing protein n=1 Tax=Streptomyces solicavernae TaxID=3043614 RepID=A0ABT6RW31_9ACTN|nr:DUF397 domain-containing protein [Streptomyces sp. B-S-A8]MDI3388655.1 DUF397 domain-containing protein [Streptomyces sp. B-S-A8]
MREYDLRNAHWHKSSYSDQHGGDCVEVAQNLPGIVPVRDTKLSGDGPVLLVPARSWAEFIEAVKA